MDDTESSPGAEDNVGQVDEMTASDSSGDEAAGEQETQETTEVDQDTRDS
jgi:hypothetical protein